MMDDVKLRKYKTVMCQRILRSNSCRYGLLCDFAHEDSELRRNLNQNWYYGIKCEKENCRDKMCQYAHNDMEIMYHPHVYKTKMCTNFTRSCGCAKKNYCSFAHGKQELRTGNPGVVSPVPVAGGPATVGGGSVSGGVPSVRTPVYHHRSGFGQQTVPHQKGSITGAAQQIAPAPVDFQETTNDLKIRILDLVDQVSALHFDRASLDQQKAKAQYANEVTRLNGLLQESYTSLETKLQDEHDEISDLMHQLSERQQKCSELELMVSLLSGGDAFRLVGPTALDELSKKRDALTKSIERRKAELASQKGPYPLVALSDLGDAVKAYGNYKSNT